MEASHLPNKHPSDEVQYQAGHRLLVRMGGKEWIVGEDEAEPLSPRRNDSDEKTTSTSSMDSTSKSILQPKAWMSWMNRLWMDLHRFAIQSLDKMLNQSSQGMPDMASQRKRFVAKTSQESKVRDAITFGTITGLMLGCIGLVVFHQVAPERMKASDVATNTAISVPVAAPPNVGQGFLVPAVQVFATQIGSYRSIHDAAMARSRFLAKGITTTSTSVNPIRLLTSAAIQSSHLVGEQHRLEKDGVSSVVTTLAWPVTGVSVYRTSSTETIGQITRWLSSDVSALNVMIGEVSDHVPARDASAAYQNAEKIRPSAAELDETGHGPVLKSLQDATEKAYAELQRGQSRAAMMNMIDAYALMQSLVEHPVPSLNS